MAHHTHDGMEKIFDINSQNSLLGALPSSWPEPDLHLQQGSVSMPQNATIHQNGYGPMLIEQEASYVSPIYSNQVQQPSSVAMTDNSFGLITPMSPTPLSNDDVPDFINGLLDLEGNVLYNINWQMDTLHQATTQSTKDLEIERLLGQVRAYDIQKHLVGTASMNGVTQCEKRILPESSPTSFPRSQEFNSTTLRFPSTSTMENGPSSHVLSSTNAKTTLLPGEQLSANMLRILNMSTPAKNKRGRPRRQDSELIKQLGQFQPQPLGHPRKRREGEESSSISGKFQKQYSGTRSIVMTAEPKEAHKTPENAQNEDQSANLANPSSAPRQYLNSVYDTKYQNDGGFVDPHLRFFNAIQENDAAPTHGSIG